MRYIAAATAGPADVMNVASGPLPAIGPDDVLIKVAYAGVNRPDILQRGGSYAPPDRKSVV